MIESILSGICALFAFVFIVALIVSGICFCVALGVYLYHFWRGRK